MEEPEPLRKLEYERHPRQGQATWDIPLFLLGLIMGTTASGLIWWRGRIPLIMHGSGKAILVVLAAKLTISIAAILFQRTRGFGLGLLVSIPIGGLIFFGVCASMPLL